MKNTVILIHKKREDLKELIENFQDTYFYICWQTDIESTWVKKIKTMPYHEKNVLGSGIQKIFDDLPGYSIIIVNENTTIDDIRNLYAQLQENQCMIISANDPGKIISKKKNTGVKIITGLFNIVHRQKAENVMSNVQAIPADYVKHFLKLKGDTCNTLLSQRFIIKDQNLNFKYIQVNGSVLTDVPDSFFGYLKCIFIICLVFIKFMLSSVSAFLLDYALFLGGYNLWSPLIANFFANLNFAMPGVFTDVAIISTGIARTISSIYNYFINKKVVFAQAGNESKLSTACKYFALVIIIWVFNTIILKVATIYLYMPVAIAKLMADIIMYFVSFTVQRDIIFIKRNK